jgi:hypothetical protein
MTSLLHFKPTALSLFVTLILACFALSPVAQAVSPPPDGGYPNANTAEGNGALFSLTSGADNTAIGLAALGLNVAGSDNTAVGTAALLFNTASQNTAVGSVALFNNTTGTQNTANGFGALFSNTTISGVSGSNNTAVGFEALVSNTTGFDNTAVGSGALSSNTVGSSNTAVGSAALRSSTGATSQSTAVGFAALENAVNANDAFGYKALNSVTSGVSNVAVGARALFHNTGGDNIALGNGAGFNLTTGGGNIDIGNSGVAGDDGTIRIGNADTSATFIAGIRGTTTANNDAIAVVIDSAGQLGTLSSSARFKTEIKPMDKSSEALLALKPVTFHYKNDSKGIPQFGLIAEEVAKVNPDLVVRDKDGEVYTVRYDAVNAMLLNEFLKEHGKVETLEATVANLVTTVKEQAAQIQKVSAQLEVSKAAPQTVENNQ